MLFQQLCDVRIQLILDILPVGPIGVLGFVTHELLDFFRKENVCILGQLILKPIIPGIPSAM